MRNIDMITLIGVPFDFAGMTYYSTSKDIEIGSKVVCTTPHGTFIGTVAKIRKPSEEELVKTDFDTIFPSIDRIANFQDLAFDREAKVKEAEITRVTQQESDELKLNMNILNTYLDLSSDKALITFTSDNRVDFRELVKILIGMFHLRIELRQIGPRDQAKLIGGIGACGLPICCSTFLNSFDGISIAMAKNQLLAINIPKLSGQCGKLMCCLKFEDEAYAQLRPTFPKIGDKITYRKSEYEVTGLNVLSGIITAYNGDNYENFTKEQYERVQQGLDKGDEDELIIDMNSGVDLSGKGIEDTKQRIEQIKKSEEKHLEDLKNRAKKANNNRNRNNRNNHSDYHRYSKNAKKDTGFIPVSQIADREVLNVKAVKHDEKK